MNNFLREPTKNIFEILHLNTLVSLIFFSILFSSVAVAQQQEVVLTTGTSWVVPSDADLSTISVECWGGGGGGAYTSGSKNAGGGGGGGAYSQKGFPSFTAGQTISYEIGDGGSGASGTHAGGDTWFFANAPTGVMAKGGEGAVNNSENGAAGGAAGSSIGAVKHNGGKGGKGSYTSGSICGDELASGGGGAAATPASTGAGGGNADTETGNLFCSGNHATAGSGGSNLLFTGYTSKGGIGTEDSGNGHFGVYGGGGSGAVKSTYNGGDGGNGLIRITYIKICITYGTDTQSACETFDWIDGNTYTSNNTTATHTLVGQNQYGCDSIVTLDLTINNATTGTDTQTACGSFDWIDGNTYTADNNSATFTLTAANGCDSVVTLDLTMTNAATGTDTQTACGSFDWIDGNTYTADNNSATFTLTTVNGCDSVVTLDLTMTNAATGTDTQTACGSFDWIDGNTYTADNNSATFTLTTVNGCDSIVTLDLTMTGPTTGTDTQIGCGSFDWIDGNTYTADNNTATHTLTGVNGCDSVVTLNLTMSDPSSSFTLTDFCAGTANSATITGTTGGTFSIVSPTGDGATIDAATGEIIDGVAGTTYEIEYETGGPCSVSETHEVTLGDAFYIEVVPESGTITQGESIDLHLVYDPNNNVDGITWTPSSGLSCSDCKDPVAAPGASTNYIVTVTSEDGCTTSDTAKITVIVPCSDVFVPNTFSPNGDGLNDFQCVLGECVLKLDFTIYDRWGEPIFHSEEQKDCWDGTFRGKLVQSGVYVYKLKASLDNGIKIERTGDITVVR